MPVTVPSLLMEDHCDAYVFWKERGLSGATCVHVDAHLDVSEAGLSTACLQAMAAARTGAELEPLRVSNYLPWGGFHCGNYLYPALCEGLVTRLIWVVPDWMLPERGAVEWARGELQNWVDLRLDEYRDLCWRDGRVEGHLAGRPLTLCRADRLPDLPRGVLLDVDVDYFLDADDGLWQSPFDLADRLQGLRPAALTVAYSVNGGYTPLEHRWLGPATLKALEEPTSPWRVWAGALTRGAEPPGDVPAFARASRAAARGRWEEARALDPAFVPRAINRGSLHFRRKEHEQALTALREARREAPEEAPLVDYLMGLTHSRAGRPEEACDCWEELVEEPRLGERERAYVSFLLARELGKQKRFVEALEAFERALRAEPDNPTYLHHYGIALVDGGFPEQAAKTLRRSLRLAPDRLAALEVHLELARLYKALGQPAFAQAELRALEQKDPSGVYKLKAMLEKP